MVSDRFIIASALIVILLGIWWWIYRLAMMKRSVDNLTYRHKRDSWKLYREDAKYELDLSLQRKYRDYRTVVSRVADSIDLDRSADSERADTE